MNRFVVTFIWQTSDNPIGTALGTYHAFSLDEVVLLIRQNLKPGVTAQIVWRPNVEKPEG